MGLRSLPGGEGAEGTWRRRSYSRLASDQGTDCDGLQGQSAAGEVVGPEEWAVLGHSVS